MGKKLSYSEGTWFAIPLRDKSGYAVGLVARLDGKGGVLGYFFGDKFSTPPVLGLLKGYESQDAILVRRFGDLGFIRGSWIILGNVNNWTRESWPVPHFSRISEDGLVSWRVHYSDKDGTTALSESEISLREAKLLPEDGLSGYGAIEARLTKLLENK